MRILGIHFGSHDTSAALIEDGKIVAVIEQERFDHIKHTMSFPKDAVDYCLSRGGVTLKELDFVAYASDAAFSNVHKKTFINTKVSEVFSPRMSNQKELEDAIYSNLKQGVPLFYVNHHLAHAASTYYLSPFHTAAIFTVDGMGNWVTTTTLLGHNNTMESLTEIQHPHSLGLFYGAVTQFLGFRAASDECKVMGLASYGSPKYLNDFRKICSYENGTIILDLDYFTFHNKPLMRGDGTFNEWYSDKFVQYFGDPRIPESEIKERDRDIAHSVQAILEERVYQLLNDLYHKINCENLCLAGGVALNSSMNGKITHNTPFKKIFIVPAANDAGLSIGAAMYCAISNSHNIQRKELKHAYYGSEYSDADVEKELKKMPKGILISKPADLVNEGVKLLSDFAIVGWYQGRMEFGPRALGNRSILANPTKAEMKDILNQKVKFRENFRPFAPVVPLEYVSDYFETTDESPFMLKVVQVVPEKIKVIPAVTHVDNTARVQTVTAEQNPLLYRLLHAMKEANGVPVLLNTSFNIRGDTIVRTPADAINCFLKTGMNALAINSYLIVKEY